MLPDIEMKLLRLALDRAASEGEINNAATTLIRKWRARNISAEDFDLPARRVIVIPFGKHKGKELNDVPTDYLMWVLANCTNINVILRNEIERILGI